MCVCVCVFVCVVGTLSVINTGAVRNSSRLGDKSLFLNMQNIVSEDLVKFWGTVRIEVMFLVRLSTMNGSQCNILTSIAKLCVYG